jgi:hypothetical protein
LVPAGATLLPMATRPFLPTCNRKLFRPLLQCLTSWSTKNLIQNPRPARRREEQRSDFTLAWNKPGTDVLILKYFHQTNMAVLTQNFEKLCKNWILKSIFKKNANFKMKIVENSRKC